MKFLVALIVLLQGVIFVKCQPTIIGGTESVTELVGTNARLQCNVENLGIYTVSWVRLNPVVLISIGPNPFSPGDTRYRIVDTDNWVLEISNVTVQDAGNYQCQINTSPAETFQATLEVAVPAKIDIIEPLEVIHLDTEDEWKRIFNESDSAVLFCATSGIPTPTVTWTRSGGPLPGGGSSLVSDTLVFDKIGRDSAGRYECKATNGYGDVAEVVEEIEIVVQYKPRITVTDSDFRVGSGSQAQLRCIAHASPEATFAWYKGNVSITEFSQSGSLSMYSIQRVDPTRDFGEYRCVATNLLGSSQGIMTISGNPKNPIITSHPKSNRRNEYMLTWSAAQQGGGPILQYRMKYRRFWDSGTANGTMYGDWVEMNYTPSFSAAQYEMALDDLVAGSSYKLRLWAVNEYGDGDVARHEFETATVDRVVQPSSISLTSTTKPTKLVTKKDGKTATTKSSHIVTGPVKDDSPPRTSLSIIAMATVLLLQIFL